MASHSNPACLQFAQLPQLQRLKLFACDYSAHSLSRFSALSGSLTRLDVQHFGLPTPSLAALTRLQHLRYCPDDLGIAAEAIAYALPHLTGLTCLVSLSECGCGAWRCRCPESCAK